MMSKKKSNKSKKVWKVFDLKDGLPHFLFHGLGGSRRASVGKWLNAEKKDATDGSGTTVYTSGFHAFPSQSDVVDWAKYVNHVDDRVVVRVDIRRTRPKSHGRGNVILADQLRISPSSWVNRIPLPQFLVRSDV